MQKLIDNTGQYCFFWIAAYVLGGIISYTVDRMYTTRFVTWLYNMCHEKQRQITKPIGLIYGHRTRWKFGVAFAVSTFQSVSLFFCSQFHSNPFIELTLWLVEVPAMVIGFVLGYWLFPLWEKRQKLYEVADVLDRKVEERHELHSQKKAEDVNGAEPPVATVKLEEPIKAPPQPPPEPQIDPSERIRRFTERSKGRN